MSRTITINYLSPTDEKWLECISWLTENVGKIKTYGGPLKAYGWEMWDAESKTRPTYMQTKIMFYKAEHAMLFALRWS